MKANKKTMLAAALAVAVVALAGVGYAAVAGTHYTATTTNTDNGLNSTYLELVQGGAGQYTNNFFTGVYFDSENAWNFTTSTATTSYTPVFGYKVDATATPNTIISATADTGANLALVSNQLQLTIIPTNNNAESATVTVGVTNFTPVDGLVYTMVLASSVTTTSDSTTITVVDTDTVTFATYEAAGNKAEWSLDITLNTGSGDTNQTILYALLFIGGTSTGTMDEHAGFAAAPSTIDSDGNNENVFTFIVDAEEPPAPTNP